MAFTDFFQSMSSNSRRESLAKPLLRGPNPYAEHIKNHPNHQIFVEKLRNLDGPMVKLVNEVDDDPSPPTSFEFINSFRFAPDVEQLDPAFVCGCDCPQSGCDDPKECECLDDYDMDPELRRFSYTKHGKVVRDNRFCLIECNSKCSCGPECSSRVVQNGRKIPLEIFKTKDKGWGGLYFKF
jgi:histone-lysine N-methyltransferase SUV39H